MGTDRENGKGDSVKVDRLEWWCDICKHGTAFEEPDVTLVSIHAQMHRDSEQHKIAERSEGF